MTQIELIKKYGISVRGHLGQHLLVDENIAKKITDLLEWKSPERVLEIGPGLGALTSILAERGMDLTAVEKDPKFAEIMTAELARAAHFKMVNADFLEWDLESWIQSSVPAGKKFKVISNLPYYITAPILFRLIDVRGRVETAVLMMQKEVADRLLAKPGTKEYGRLTLAVQYAAEIRAGFKVPPGCFTPKPEVDSYVLTLHFKEKPMLGPAEEKLFFELTKAAFQQRRKVLLPLILPLVRDRFDRAGLEAVFKKLGLAPDVRGERLSLEDFVHLVKAL